MEGQLEEEHQRCRGSRCIGGSGEHPDIADILKHGDCEGE